MAKPSKQSTEGPRTTVRDAAHRAPVSPAVVALGESLTIEQAAAMHAELSRHLHAPSVAIEAGALERVDTAGLQLLTAFVRTARDRGTQVVWRSPSTTLRAAARHLGLETALRLP